LRVVSPKALLTSFHIESSLALSAATDNAKSRSTTSDSRVLPYHGVLWSDTDSDSLSAP